MSPSKHILQHSLEELFNKNQLIPKLRSVFYDNELLKIMEQHEIHPIFGVNFLVQISLHKRANVATMVGVLRHYFATAQEVAEELMKCVDADLADFDDETEMFIVLYEVNKDVQEELDRFQFPLPMVIPPKELKENTDSAYLTAGRDSVILKSGNHHDGDVCLEHLNHINQIKLSINEKVMALVRNSWKNLDKKKADETVQEFRQRQRAFEKFDRTAKDVMSLLLSEDNELYLTHKYDKRGRTYCQGYHVNYQGNPWCKATVEFADKEVTC